MHYYFEQDIDSETVNALVEKLQDVEGKIDLWFTTTGGYKPSMNYLISFLNSRKEDITITLTDRLCSAGTMLFADFKGKIIIHEGLDFVLFHAFDRESYSIRKDVDVPAKELTKQDRAKNKKFAKNLLNKGILTEKQVKKFHKGLDVVFLKKDIKRLKLIIDEI